MLMSGWIRLSGPVRPDAGRSRTARGLPGRAGFARRGERRMGATEERGRQLAIERLVLAVSGAAKRGLDCVAGRCHGSSDDFIDVIPAAVLSRGIWPRSRK